MILEYNLNKHVSGEGHLNRLGNPIIITNTNKTNKQTTIERIKTGKNKTNKIDMPKSTKKEREKKQHTPQKS